MNERNFFYFTLLSQNTDVLTFLFCFQSLHLRSNNCIDDFVCLVKLVLTHVRYNVCLTVVSTYLLKTEKRRVHTLNKCTV